jgi:hypothetical protein
VQWGAIVASLLVLGTLPFFLGLAVTLPLLSHASWHLYRRAVAPDTTQDRRTYAGHIASGLSGRRSAADFPVSILPWARSRPQRDE